MVAQWHSLYHPLGYASQVVYSVGGKQCMRLVIKSSKNYLAAWYYSSLNL